MLVTTVVVSNIPKVGIASKIEAVGVSTLELTTALIIIIAVSLALIAGTSSITSMLLPVGWFTALHHTEGKEPEHKPTQYHFEEDF